MSQEQGIDLALRERCEGWVLGEMASTPGKSAQAWAPEAEENQIPTNQPGDKGEGNVVHEESSLGNTSDSHVMEETPIEDSQLSNEFNFADNLFSSNTKAKEWKMRFMHSRCHEN